MMQFNKDKCKILRLGRNNHYILGAMQLEGNFAERDLEILVYTKFTEQLRMGETSEDHLAQSFVGKRVDEII